MGVYGGGGVWFVPGGGVSQCVWYTSVVWCVPVCMVVLCVIYQRDVVWCVPVCMVVVVCASVVWCVPVWCDVYQCGVVWCVCMVVVCASVYGGGGVSQCVWYIS